MGPQAVAHECLPKWGSSTPRIWSQVPPKRRLIKPLGACRAPLGAGPQKCCRHPFRFGPDAIPMFWHGGCYRHYSYRGDAACAHTCNPSLGNLSAHGLEGVATDPLAQGASMQAGQPYSYTHSQSRVAPWRLAMSLPPYSVYGRWKTNACVCKRARA